MVSTELPTVLYTDENDPPETDLYAGQVFLYPWAHKVYVAFPTCYYPYKGDERKHLSPTGLSGNADSNCPSSILQNPRCRRLLGG